MEHDLKLPRQDQHGNTLWTRGAMAAGLALSMLLILLPSGARNVGAQEEVTFCLVNGETRETVTLMDTLAVDAEGNLLESFGPDSFLGACEEAVIDIPPGERLDAYSGELVPKDGGAYALGVIDDDDDDEEDADLID
jgi:hypothetical protein